MTQARSPAEGSLHGKRCVLTGATAGIGRAAATGLVRAGADLCIVARSPDKAARVKHELEKEFPGREVDVVLADFASLSQVRSAAGELRERYPQIDVLFNNAGVVNLTREVSEDGIEMTFAVNHLGYFLFTTELLDPLREAPAARIVLTASDAHKFGGAIDFDDLGMERGYRWTRAYGRSKAANILFAQELTRRLAGSGVTVNAFHPGFVRSDLGGNHGGWSRLLLKAISPFARTPERGAETGLWLATAPEMADRSGGYYQDCKPLAPGPHARSEQDAKRLWEHSEALTAGSMRSAGA